MASHELEVHPDASAAAARFAALLGERARSGIAARGRFTLALSGGRGPWEAFRLLAGEDVDWDRVEIFQVDERIAPRGDDARNLTHLEASLPSPAVERLQPMPVENPNVAAAAARYAALLPETLDLVHLGLGPDGHTASLVPGDSVLDVRDRDVALTGGEYQGHRRMTLTYPVLERAGELLWFVTGEDKVDALRRLLADDPSIPAGRVRNPRSVVVADRAAAPGQ